MNILLIRDAETTPGHTFGRMRLGGEVVVQTIERPWLANQKGVSCVPEGTYKLVLHNSENHPKSFALVNPLLGVIHWPDAAYPEARTAVLIHVANYASELRGCIAPGIVRGLSGSLGSVLQSKTAMAIFNLLVPWTEGHTLTIKRGD
jgi:hypothetical protein